MSKIEFSIIFSLFNAVKKKGKKDKYVYKLKSNLSSALTPNILAPCLLCLSMPSLYALSWGLREPFDMPPLSWQGCISSLGPLGAAKVPEDVRVH